MCVTTIFSRPKLVRQSIFHGVDVHVESTLARRNVQAGLSAPRRLAWRERAKRRHAQATVYTLRWLMFAPGDQHSSESDHRRSM